MAFVTSVPISIPIPMSRITNGCHKALNLRHQLYDDQTLAGITLLNLQNFNFYTNSKYLKTKGFLTFPGSTEKKQWPETG